MSVFASWLLQCNGAAKCHFVTLLRDFAPGGLPAALLGSANCNKVLQHLLPDYPGFTCMSIADKFEPQADETPALQSRARLYQPAQHRRKDGDAGEYRH